MKKSILIQLKSCITVLLVLVGTLTTTAQDNPFDTGVEQKAISEPKNFFIAPLWGMNWYESTNHDFKSVGNTYGANFSYNKDKHKRNLTYVLGLHYSTVKYRELGVKDDFSAYFEQPREQLSIPLLIRIAKLAEIGVSSNHILNYKELNEQQSFVIYNKEYWRIFYGFGGRFVPIGSTGGGIVCQLHMGFNLSRTGEFEQKKFNDGMSVGFNVSYDIPVK